MNKENNKLGRGLSSLLSHSMDSRDDQEAVLAAVRFKTEVLWAQLDALYFSYVKPGFIPPGSFVPKGFKENSWM